MAVHSETAVAAQRTEGSGVRRVLGLAVLAGLSVDTRGWGTFALLLVLASVAQLFIVETPGGQSYRTAIVFIIAAAILLPAQFVVLISVLHYVPSWFRHKRKNYTRAFNVANTTLGALAAWAAFHAIREMSDLRYVAAGA